MDSLRTRVVLLCQALLTALVVASLQTAASDGLPRFAANLTSARASSLEPAPSLPAQSVAVRFRMWRCCALSP